MNTQKKKSSVPCRLELQRKIATNIREKKYPTNKQAIAVSYSQVLQDRPQCSRALKRKGF